MIKRLIFDVDNTIITGVDFNPAIEKLLKKHNIYSEENFKFFNEATRKYEEEYQTYTYEYYLGRINRFLKMNLSINFLLDYFEFLKGIIPPYNQELINYFKNISDYYELVLLTNYFESSQRNRLKNMGINDFFKECYGESIIKPNKEVFIKSCGNYFPCECIMIGDSLKHDILPAKEVGMKTIYVSKDKEYDGIKVSNIKEITRELINKIN